MTTDPSGISLNDPQQLNLYSYVRNNPLALIDPTGLECIWDDGSYDSDDDPDTGSPDKCQAAGGTWIGKSYFDEEDLADWSSLPDDETEQVALQPQGAPFADASVYGLAGNPFATVGESQSSWWGTFGKTFVKDFATSVVSRQFYRQQFAPGGCLNAAVEGTESADVLGVIPASGVSAEDTIQSASAAYAARYSRQQGLTVPLRSSVVRGILGTGETVAGYAAPVYFDVVASYGVVKEAFGPFNGSCH